MRFFPTFGFLVLIIRCGCLPIEIVPDVHYREGSSLAAALGMRRVKKDAVDGMGFEECSFVESWQKEPGFINVLAFLDVSWEYSHRQATMLKMLQERLERSGITEIRFFVINSAEPTATISNVDTEDEKEAWGAAEHADDLTFSEIERTREALKEKIGPDIAFVQDNKELKIWEKLSVSRDQVLVIDKCGRLSYRVIVPWSILHFPYVKAAILSTYKEQPCGACSLETVETTTVAHVGESKAKLIEDMIPENLTIKQMEEIVVKKYNLDESDYTVMKMHHGSESQDIPESVIKLLNGSVSVQKEKVTTGIENVTKGDLNLDDSYVISYSQSPIPTDADNEDDNQENLSVTGNTSSNSNSSSTIINETGESVEKKRDDPSDDENLGKNDKDEENSDPKPGLVGENETSFDSELWNTPTLSSMEQTDNYIQRTTQSSVESDYGVDSESADYIMPIRIIMHAPHIHEHEEPCKKHEYLVLKVGIPEYHGHLEYESSKDTVKENYEVDSGSGEVGNEDEKHHCHGKKDGCKENKGGHLGVIFDKDESPGFYGEDSEYWRNFGNTAYQGELAIEQQSEEETKKPLEGSDAVNTTDKIESASETAQTIEDDKITNTGNTEFQTNVTAEEIDDIEEDEIANHLVQHYSKLIPWLDYVID